MDKDFENWFKDKKKLDKEEVPPFYHEREVWWCALGVNVGSEQDGTGKNFDRPVVVIRGFNKDVCFVVALTGKKRESKFHLYLGEVEGVSASAILSQVRLVDTRRLIKKICTLDEKIFIELKKRLQKTLFS